MPQCRDSKAFSGTPAKAARQQWHARMRVASPLSEAHRHAVAGFADGGFAVRD
jgi:hypothetical protein